MNQQSASEVSKQLKMGKRIKFCQKLGQWQNSLKTAVRTMPASGSSSMSSQNALPVTPVIIASKNMPHFMLEDVLKMTNDGRLMLKYYAINANLNEPSRTLLVEIIIQHLLETDVCMSVTLADSISNQILKLFPTEIKVILIT